MSGQIQTTNTGYFNTGKKSVFPSGVTVEGTPYLDCSQKTINGKQTDVIKDDIGLWYFLNFHDVITGTDKDTNVEIDTDNAVYNSKGDNVTNKGKLSTINAKQVTNFGDWNNINAEYVTSENGDENTFYNAKQVVIKKGKHNKIVDPNHYSNATEDHSFLIILPPGNKPDPDKDGQVHNDIPVPVTKSVILPDSKAVIIPNSKKIPVDIPFKKLDELDKVQGINDKDLPEIKAWAKTTIIKDEGENTQIEIPVVQGQTGTSK